MNKNGIPDLVIENASLLFLNFSGRQDDYNRAGNRNFCVIVPPDSLEAVKAAGWNVKTRVPKDPDSDPYSYINVKVNYNGFKDPEVITLCGNVERRLTEESIDQLDQLDIVSADVILSPYVWDVNGKTGIKAYLKKLYVEVYEDPIDRKRNARNQVNDETPF